MIDMTKTEIEKMLDDLIKAASDYTSALEKACEGTVARVIDNQGAIHITNVSGIEFRSIGESVGSHVNCSNDDEHNGTHYGFRYKDNNFVTYIKGGKL